MQSEILGLSFVDIWWRIRVMEFSWQVDSWYVSGRGWLVIVPRDFGAFGDEERLQPPAARPAAAKRPSHHAALRRGENGRRRPRPPGHRGRPEKTRPAGETFSNEGSRRAGRHARAGRARPGGRGRRRTSKFFEASLSCSLRAAHRESRQNGEGARAARRLRYNRCGLSSG